MDFKLPLGVLCVFVVNNGTMGFQPSYIFLYQRGELTHRVQQAYRFLEACTLCPYECKVNRFEEEVGFCQADARLKVAEITPHFGEEAPIVGQYGSGAIFFSYCNMGCVFCQNYDINLEGRGRIISTEELADGMLTLQAQKCHNINLISPTHYIPQILEGVFKAVSKGLKIPLVYNCGGYESVSALHLLRGVVDIYLPDVKYSDDRIAQKYSKVPDYFKAVKLALKEMYYQVGDLQVNKEGIAERGLLVRHLVMPGNLADTEQIVRFIAEEISKNTYLNLMDQYQPAYKAMMFKELKRRTTSLEYHQAMELARNAQLHRFDETDTIWLRRTLPNRGSRPLSVVPRSLSVVS